ncbi:MAG: putative sugar nucleotidyl transferase, partial [Candidatus Nezhaarchaeales archaeon]
MNIVTLCVFEDDYYENFLPMTYTKPVFDLICGSKPLLERMLAELRPQKVLLFTRDYLREKLIEKTSFIVNEVDVEGETLIVNGRLLVDFETASILCSMKLGEALICEDTLVAMKLGEGVARGALANKIFEPRLVKSFANIKEVSLKLVKYP